MNILLTPRTPSEDEILCMTSSSDMCPQCGGVNTSRLDVEIKVSVKIQQMVGDVHARQCDSCGVLYLASTPNVAATDGHTSHPASALKHD